ncbi:phosphatidylglycerophosphatase A [Blochmannia endosymbiont of Camponotus (Colobopsis) obliquus]|uniref:phosphatidylglycerophosphatase A n=1 Tax=Blochmannia endosymbiont of Camponotus (Colobopsis) obliquus TaxID=1505597 RepID=UPI00061A6EC5|nr:phosphatidylglycerophosphatase A [Blochmannia endosymbiont of Camponotus (Colobopsis) obliquus]AKC60400.1 phosphatidylglycerophosphatase A [Blochmannia endosymbiont of Camponotus (Colobopsis) obliquus]
MNIRKKIKLTNPYHLIATGFGIGMVPYMPGTLASLIAIVVWFFVSFLPYQLCFILFLLALILGLCSCHQTVKDIGIHDHRSIVWDEYIGMWCALIGVSINDWYCLIFSFLLFRVIDICKPWPIGWLDRVVKGGMGILIDDIVAGFFTSFILYIVV